MAHTPRIAIQLDPADPFWVELGEAIRQQSQSRSVEIVELLVHESELLSIDEQIEVVEHLFALELDALICSTYRRELLVRILDSGLPIITVAETSLRHERLTSRTGLYDAGQLLGAFLNGKLTHEAQVVVVGGQGDGEDTGQSRIDGFVAGLAAHSPITLRLIASTWSPDDARHRVEEQLLAHLGPQIDVIFGLSDALTLAAQAIYRSRGRLRDGAFVLGINGDPRALAAIAAGQMAATVEADVDDLAAQALDLALRAADGEALPALFACRQRLICADTIAEATARKLISLAALLARQAEANRRQERQRTLQVELSAAIDRNAGLLLDEPQLIQAFTTLIRDGYGFDLARFLRVDIESGLLVPPSNSTAPHGPGNELDPPLAYALTRSQPVFIPNTGASRRFPPDPRWPQLQSRVVVPVRLGGQLIGLLDLHCGQEMHHTHEELVALQLLADRFGITLLNAQLSNQEQDARLIAEQAERLKTTLLANISHELRTPLNVILGYTRGALDAMAHGKPPTELADDLTQIYHSGEHLLRLVNDLLDLSRAEIGELDLVVEQVATRPFLEEVFRACVKNFEQRPRVEWQLNLPAELPTIEADPTRLRQILFNLLHNAHKFTERGVIALGAEVDGAELHLWVADTGPGIAQELRTQIFDPFVSVKDDLQADEGIGLGLSVTHRLVALHQGRVAIASDLGEGTTVSIYLPLPPPERAGRAQDAPARRVLLLLGEGSNLPAAVVQLAERRALALHTLRLGDNLAGALETMRPALLAWDVAAADDNSWRLIEELRSVPELRRLPVMIYGGAADASVETAGAASGVLLKPVGDQVLLDVLSDLQPSTPDGSILIVEGDPNARAQHRRLIAQHLPGYSIHDAGDGRTALEVVAARTPSLIVLDLMLPELDGFAVLEALRANRHTAAIPVLVLSEKALTGDDIRRLSQARVMFQTKGMLTGEEFAERLRRALSPTDGLSQHTSGLVKQALAFIQQQHGQPLSRQAIADAVGVHKDYLGRIFQQEVGLSPWEYLVRYRVLRARGLLRGTELTVAEVAAKVGFETPAYFSLVFSRQVGLSPRAYRARHRS